jgi:hypothetical protein
MVSSRKTLPRINTDQTDRVETQDLETTDDRENRKGAGLLEYRAILLIPTPVIGVYPW